MNSLRQIISVFVWVWIINLLSPLFYKYNKLIFLLSHIQQATKLNMPLTDVLKAIARDARGRFKYVIERIRHNIEQGHTPGEAFARHRAYFPAALRNIFVCQDIAVDLELYTGYVITIYKNIVKAREKLTMVLFIWVITSIVIIVFLFINNNLILPRFEQMIKEIGISTFAGSSIVLYTEQAYLYLFVFILFILFIDTLPFTILYYYIPYLKDIIDTTVIYIPILKDYIMLSSLNQISIFLGTMLEKGIPVEEAFENIQNLDINTRIKKEFDYLTKRLKSGERLDSVINDSSLLPEDMKKGVVAFYNTPELSNFFIRLSKRYLDRLCNKIGYIEEVLPVIFVFITGCVVMITAVLMFGALVNLIYGI